MARSLLRRRGHLAFCHYERSEVIQKQVLLANRLRQSLRFFAMTKGLRQVPLRVTRNLQQPSSQVTRSTEQEICDKCKKACHRERSVAI